MKKILFILVSFLLVFTFSAGFAQEFIEGMVYEDANHNLKKDRKEKGVPNVSVSNGLDVVQTDAKGSYRLPAFDDQIIFVIKPSGYTTPVNSYNLPQFYYIHKSEGSPELKYGGSPSTGKIPASVNFALYPDVDQDQFKMLLFGDPQPYTKEEVDFFDRGIVAEVAGVKDVDFGLSMGDLVGDNLDLFQPYKEAVQHVGIPWYNVMGNHDMNYDASEDKFSDETFERHFGPSNYAFNHGKVHFVILDDILYPDPRDGKGYWGGFRKDQLDFLENDLKYVPRDYLVALAFHIPISEPGNGDPFRDEDRERLFNLLKDFPRTLSISAHTHLQRQDLFYPEDGWKGDGFHHHFNVGTTSGDWYSGRLNEDGIPYSTMRDGTPKGYAFVTFDRNNYEVAYKVAGKPADYQFEIYAPKVLEKDKRTSSGIIANFFMGSKKDKVFYRVDEGEWEKMNPLEDYDPSYFHSVQQWDFADTLWDGRRPSNPEKCTHLWYAGIPTKLPTGEHTIEIKATDLFGKTHTQKKTYRIAEK